MWCGCKNEKRKNELYYRQDDLKCLTVRDARGRLRCGRRLEAYARARGKVQPPTLCATLQDAHAVTRCAGFFLVVGFNVVCHEACKRILGTVLP